MKENFNKQRIIPLRTQNSAFRKKIFRCHRTYCRVQPTQIIPPHVNLPVGLVFSSAGFLSNSLLGIYLNLTNSKNEIPYGQNDLNDNLICQS